MHLFNTLSAVLFQEKIYVVAMGLSYKQQSEVYCASIDLDSWTKLSELDLLCFGIGTYQSKLVLVGGVKVTGEVCNDWSLSSNGITWQPSLLPMPTKRYSSAVVNTGNPEYLVVAGGLGESDEALDVVEVLIEGNWFVVKPLPISCRIKDYCFHDRKLFLNPASIEPFIFSVVYCKIKTLLAHCNLCAAGGKSMGILWKTIDRNRDIGFSACGTTKYRLDKFARFFASLGGRLVTSKCDAPWPRAYLAFAHSPVTKSWVSVGNVPDSFNSFSAITVALPTGELVVMSGIKIYRSTLRGI